MNAVLLAAGRGTRLGALTATRPKPLLDVGGRPLIGHILDGVARAGVRDVTIVTGYLADVLEAELARAPGPMRLRFVRQARLDGTARALALARETLGDGAFFFGWGDIYVHPSNHGRVIAASAGVDAALAVNEVDDPWAGAAVTVDESGFVRGLVEKPPRGTSQTRWNNAGFGVLPPAIWPYVDALAPSPRGEYELPQAIAAFIADGGKVRAVPVEGPWFDVGTPESLAAARAAANAPAPPPRAY